ncbi:MAG: hypothetical protein MUE41_18265 [Gemmatimonadaceae bacterium]|jgi:hypothetical protein|nr:hypothetical protein [Gemmatimonadaceae bacterium]
MHRTRLLPAAVVALAGIAVLAGCRDANEPVACPAIVKNSVEMRILDARTGLAVLTARGTIRDGSFVDSLRTFGRLAPTDSGVYAWRAGQERPGTYEVSVEADGYAPWAIVLNVGRDACGVRTERLTARLVPRGP